MIKCDQKENDICKVASKLANLDIRPQEDACQRCSTCSVKQNINYVTASIAVAETNKINKENATELRKRLFAAGYFELGKPLTNFGIGPGSTLHEYLAKKGYNISPGCKCVDTILKMNSGGLEWCRNNISYIVQSIADEAKRRQMIFPERLVKMMAKRWVLTSLRLYGKTSSQNETLSRRFDDADSSDRIVTQELSG